MILLTLLGVGDGGCEIGGVICGGMGRMEASDNVGLGGCGVGTCLMTIGKSRRTLHLKRRTVALSRVKVRTSVMAGVVLKVQGTSGMEH